MRENSHSYSEFRYIAEKMESAVRYFLVHHPLGEDKAISRGMIEVWHCLNGKEELGCEEAEIALATIRNSKAFFEDPYQNVQDMTPNERRNLGEAILDVLLFAKGQLGKLGRPAP